MAAIVTRDADLRLRTEGGPRLADVAILLAEVNAVGTEALRQAHAVVDDEGHARIGTDALKRLRQPRKLMLGDVLHPQLEGRDDLVAYDRIQSFGKVAANVLRRDEIEAAGLRAPGRRKL